jgi:DUF971 family protein
MNSSSLMPVALRGTADELRITWSDGVEHQLPWSRLRANCPCAGCKSARSQPPDPFAILKPEEAAPVRVAAMRPSGNYAYHIDFTDGHNTGIFPLELLRRLGEGP